MDYLLGVFNRIAICVMTAGLWCLGNGLRLSEVREDPVPRPTAHITLLSHCRSEGELRNQLLFFLPRGNRLIFSPAELE